MAPGIRRVEARQAHTLRFFRRLRLLRPPPSSKPQRLLAATGPEPTLAADSVIGARHQLPDFVSTEGRLNRNNPIAPDANINAHVRNCTCLHRAIRIKHSSAIKTLHRSKATDLQPRIETNCASS
jgi:hypothetical protein